MGEQKIHRYAGKAAVVSWDQNLCRHAAECVRGLPQVFDTKARPWIAPDAAGVDALKETVARCPSGALVLHAADGTLIVASKPTAAPAGPTTLTLRPNGPYILLGAFEVAGASKPGETRAVLCRCGNSGNKPYCDGTHNKIFFEASGNLPPDERPGTAAPGRVTVTPTADGPFHCVGPLALAGGDGRTSAASETWLCRCGGSQTKPFCDGTHAKIGFRG